MGNNAVAGMGTASLIHQTAIQAVTATSSQASGLSPSGAGKNNKPAKAVGPSHSPVDPASRIVHLVLHAAAAQPAVTVRVPGQVLLVIIFGIIKSRRTPRISVVMLPRPAADRLLWKLALTVFSRLLLLSIKV